jgi:hypothetical protein
VDIGELGSRADLARMRKLADGSDNEAGVVAVETSGFAVAPKRLPSWRSTEFPTRIQTTRWDAPV